MKRARRRSTGRWLRVTLAIGAALLFGGSPGLAEMSSLISYQGKLMDGAGNPAADSSYAMEFRFYDSCLGGNLLLTDFQPEVQTMDGLYNVSIGSGMIVTGLESSLEAVFQNHPRVCLGVRIEDDSEMVPRQPILSVGYAFRAAVADRVVSGLESGSDVIWTGSQTFTTNVAVEDGYSITWPQTTGASPQSNFRITKFHAFPAGQGNHPEGEADEQFMVCYNCRDGDTHTADLTQHSWNQKIEATYWNNLAQREQLEVNWNFRSRGGVLHRPFALVHAVTGHCATTGSICSDDFECGPDDICEGVYDTEMTWRASPRGICSDDHTRTCLSDDGCESECLPVRQVAVEKSGTLRARSGIALTPIYAGPLLGASPAALRLTANIEPTDQAGIIRGVLATLDFNDLAGPDSSVTGQSAFAADVKFSGDVEGRDVSQGLIGFDSTVSVRQTGGAGGDGVSPTVAGAFGFRWKLVPSGTNAIIGRSAGVLLRTPAPLNVTSPLTVNEHYGILIEDQGGLGTAAGASVFVETQSGDSADRGNIHMQGGGWNDGHLQLGEMHLWVDKTHNLVRMKIGKPDAEDDGAPIQSPPSTNSDWGVVYWGDGTEEATDTGNEVCERAGLRCQETYDMGATTPRTCMARNHSTARFTVLCY